MDPYIKGHWPVLVTHILYQLLNVNVKPKGIAFFLLQLFWEM